MIAVKIHGGVGNQMFQYAMGLFLSEKWSVPLKLDISGFVINPRPYHLDKFCIEASVLTAREIQKLRPNEARLPHRLQFLSRFLPRTIKTVYVKEQQFGYDSSILSIRPPLYLDGYWQTEKYFSDVRDKVRKQFQLRASMTDARQGLLDVMLRTNAVSVHVRRGDYVSTEANLAYHGTCSPEWYAGAMRRMAECIPDVSFFIFSDDPQWARANLPGDWPTHFVDPQDDGRDFEDMHLMAHCRHHITANSSFSWWGAWLNPRHDKKVISPKKWFSGGPQNTEDVTPPDWIRI